MEVTLSIPPSTVRKIRALNILTDGALGGSINEILVTLVDRAVAGEIVNQLDLDTQTETVGVDGADYRVTQHPPAQTRTAAPAAHSDVTGISDGLGDQDDEGQAGGGVTEEALDHDMDVEDPEHEQKAEAPTFAEQMGSTAEEVFANVGAFPGVPVVDPRAARRKRKLKTRAKVSSFDGHEESTL